MAGVRLVSLCTLDTPSEHSTHLCYCPLWISSHPYSPLTPYPPLPCSYGGAGAVWDVFPASAMPEPRALLRAHLRATLHTHRLRGAPLSSDVVRACPCAGLGTGSGWGGVGLGRAD